MLRALRRALAYFGLDGTATRQDWAQAVAEVVPPLVAAWLVVRLVGVDGFAAFALWLLCYSLGTASWLLLMVRFAPWRRR